VTLVPRPEPIDELCLACVDYVKRSLGVALDFTPDTLTLLDHYARSARADLTKNAALLQVIAPALGAYFGEVVRSRLDGFWRLATPNQHDWAVCSRLAFLAINPIGVAYDAIHGGIDHDGPRSTLRVAPEDRDYVDTRLAALPPVAEDEFFYFTTRFEVLEVTAEALTTKMEEDGYGGTQFSEQDYGFE
jgi:hypothetical protein